MLSVLLSSLQFVNGAEVSVTKFGAVPDDGKNDAAALRLAAAYCRAHARTTLTFPSGEYDLHDDMAVDIERKAFSGALGRGLTVQRVLFLPQKPYVTGLDFTGCRNLTIKAYGARLVVDGWMEVLSFVGTRNVSIQGLEITYKRPAVTEARIVRSDSVSFDMQFDPKVYTYIDSIVQGRYHFYSPSKKMFYFADFRDPQLLRPGYVRVKSGSRLPLNDICAIRCGGHYRPCIMIKESENFTVKDVSIRSFPGMGIVGHLSHNIMIDGLKVIPEAGRCVSTSTDATHFTSCSGTITIKNSLFRGNCDDCTNVHNYYYTVVPQGEQAGRQVEIRIENADLHAQSLDYPTKGDVMLLVSSKNMKQRDRYVVEKVDTSAADWKVVITLDKPYTHGGEDVLMYNYTRFPKVEILHNKVDYNMARAFIVKAREVHIADNYICHSTNTALKLGAELSWREAGPVEHAVVEDNYFYESGTAMGPNDASCLMTSSESPETPPMLNHGIVIRNNIINIDHPTAFSFHDTRDVLVTKNSIRSGDVKKFNSENIVVKDNRPLTSLVPPQRWH